MSLLVHPPIQISLVGHVKLESNPKSCDVSVFMRKIWKDELLDEIPYAAMAPKSLS